MAIHPKVTPIYQTAVFKFGSLDELEAYYAAPGQHGHYAYSRAEHPNTDELVRAVATLESAAGGVATSSGLGALLAAVLAVCAAGDHVLCQAESYGGTVVLLSKELARLGIQTDYVPLADLYELDRWVRPNTKLVLAETMSNPLLTVLDGPRLAATCRAHDLRLLIDNTFPTPLLSKPLTWGADLVWHSATKYLNGHSDVIAGVVVANDPALLPSLRRLVTNLGLTLGPQDAWLTMRGLKTLGVRMRQHSANALAVAQMLAMVPTVAEVFYPGLPTHPQHQLAATQLRGGMSGGVVSFRLRDDSLEAADTFIQRAKRFPFAPSLAGVESSCSYPARTSHRGLTEEQRRATGITPGLIRLSIGIEEVDELLADLRQALS